jgi:5-methylcytosine-specific restriction endonuclease McrA
MKYSLKHKDGDILLTINSGNASKNKIVNGSIVARRCGDCNLFLEINYFDSRVIDGQRKLHTKCRQCHRVRKLIGRSFKGYDKDSSTQKILGIDYEYFIQWLNQGELKHTDKDIHIDHIVPQSLGKNTEDMKLLNHYSNLHLMTSSENLKKSNKFISKQDLEKVYSKTPNINRLKEIIVEARIELK